MPRHAVARGASAPAGRRRATVRGWPAPRKTAAAAGAGWLSAGHRRPCAAIAGPLCRLSTRQPAGRQADTHRAPARRLRKSCALPSAPHVGQGLDVALELAGWTEQQQRLAGIAQAFDADPRRMLAPRPLVGGVIQARARRVPTLEAAAERAISDRGARSAMAAGISALRSRSRRSMAWKRSVCRLAYISSCAISERARARAEACGSISGSASQSCGSTSIVKTSQSRARDSAAWPRPLPCAARDAWGARLAAVAAGRTARTAGARRSADHG